MLALLAGSRCPSPLQTSQQRLRGREDVDQRDRDEEQDQVVQEPASEVQEHGWAFGLRTDASGRYSISRVPVGNVLVEASGSRALTRGMQSFTINAARAINAAGEGDVLWQPGASRPS